MIKLIYAVSISRPVYTVIDMCKERPGTNLHEWYDDGSEHERLHYNSCRLMHRLPSSLQSQTDQYLVLIPQPKKGIQSFLLLAAITACTVMLDSTKSMLFQLPHNSRKSCCLFLSPLSQLQDRHQCPSTPSLAHRSHSLIEVAIFSGIYLNIPSTVHEYPR